MRWELEAVGGGTRLTLWHNIDRRFISMGAAGWHICLDVLDHLLGGDPIGRIVGRRRDEVRRLAAAERGVRDAVRYRSAQLAAAGGTTIRVRCTRHEEERNDQGRIPVAADRREDQGTGRLEGQDALPRPRSDQTGGPRGGRGVEVERRSGVVSRRDDLHRRDLQEHREGDVRQGRVARRILQASSIPASKATSGARSTCTKATSWTRRRSRLWFGPRWPRTSLQRAAR